MVDTFEKFLNDFNDQSNENETKWVTIGDLDVGKKYKIMLVKKIKLSFGDSILLIVRYEDDTYGLFLPRKFQGLSNKQINEMKNFFITYNGVNDKTSEYIINFTRLNYNKNLFY